MKLTKYIFLTCGIMLCHGVNAQQTCFSSANDNVFEGTGNARCITKGDFDNDGNLDVVMGNYTGTADPILQRLYFIKNNGNASFSAPVSLASGSQPLDVQSADLNNDGNLDLVVVNFNLQRMAVMLGNGDGTFQTPVGYASDFGPNKITLNDFNGDGFVDVAITTNANTVNVFMNDSGTPGTFLPFTSYPLAGGSNPSGIYSGDVNTDGNIDIVTANNGTGSTSVLNGDGTGAFLAPTDYVTGVGCKSIVLGDMNNDTFLDIITSNEDDNEISILLNDGAGNYLPTTNYATGSGPIALMVDDFNNNLNIDVVTVNTQDNSLSVLLGNGDGTVQPQDVVGAINSPRNLITGDFNNDANSDIIISCLIGQVMPVYLGDGSGTFSSGDNSFAVGNDPVSLYSADFNANGFKDVVVVNSLDNTATIHNGDGSGTNFILSTTLITGNNPTSVIGADLNNDGFEDIIVSNYVDNNISVFMSASGTFGPSTNFNANASPIEIKTGDINFDGNPDIVVLNEGNSFSVLFGDGAGGFSPPISYATGNAPLGIDVGDVNNDNFDDVVVANSNDNNIGIYTNDGTGVFGVPVNRTVGTSPNSVTFGDLNNDGAPEIVTTNFGSNNISVTQNNGSGLFGFVSTNYTSNDTGPASAVINDFDGDGNNDVAVANLVSIASTGNVAIFVGDGANVLTFDQSYSVRMDPRQVITDDFNNDGLPDLATVNNVSNNVTILLNTGGAPTITALGPTTFCAGDSVILESSPAASYFWSNGETTQSITVTTSGTYDVSTSSGIGGWCSSVSNQIVVDVTSGPVLSFTGDTVICVGESTTLVVSGATSYTWSGGLGTGDTKTVSPTATTTYTVTGDDGSACTTDLDITVTVNPLPDASFSGLNTQYCLTSTPVTLTPVTTGGTFSGPGVTSNQFDPAAAGIGTHLVEYTVTDANSCTNSSSQSVEVVSSTLDSDFSGLDTTYCVDDASSTLVPNETGGTFSGAGISGNEFNPSVAGPGSHLITHEITSGGCTSSTSYTTEVFALPDASFTGLDPSYCVDAAVATLTPTQTGGTFSGPGIIGNDFNPATAGVGIHTVTYTITDGNGCANSSNQAVEVFALPDASFTGLDPTYCIDAATVTLTPTIAGGTFSGSGIVGNDFNPATAGVGIHTITYTITDANGCTNSSNQSVEVFALPDATFTGLDSIYCIDAAVATLTPTQTGGTFSGPGITGNDFDPAAAGVGIHTITYTITDANGCTNSSNQNVEVDNTTLDATFTGLDPEYCLNDGITTLVPNEPGGTFSGSGITGSDFDPSVAGAGTHTITYTVTAGNGCTNSSSQTVEVFALPDATFTGLDSAYCIDAATVTLTPNQAGGTFSGPGITGNDFDPAAAGVGIHTITYTITDANGCVNSSNQNVEVDDQYPDATFTGLNPKYCLNSAAATLTPNEAGGAFSGPGMIGNDFDPAIAGVGIHTITYSITSPNGCTSSSNQSVEVLVLPDAGFTGLDSTYCIDGTVSTLTPNETGGTFSGPGVVGNDFDPVLAGVGIHIITYEITAGNGCSNTEDQTTEVTQPLDATFTGLDTTYCLGDPEATLVPNEPGGTFSGPGITGNNFNPGLAGLGTHTIVYEVVDGDGCSSSSSQDVEVNPLPNASFTGLDPEYCKNDVPSTLVPTTPGGVFTGNGISGNEFDPNVAGVGVHTISYIITDANGCSNISSQTTEVLAIPDASFTTLDSNYCIDAGAVTLIPNETGGTFSGPGVVGNEFDPNLAGVGTHTITYSINSANGCSNSENQIVEVDDQYPDPVFTGLDNEYCENNAVVVLVPNETGGTFTGPGVSGNEFDPAIAGVGVHTIDYVITGANGCSSSSSQIVEIIETLDATFTGLGLEYCLNDAPDTLSPTVAGGTFTGSGMSSNIFDPSLAGVGTHIITYTQTNTNGCVSSSSQEVEVHEVLDATFSGLEPSYCSNEAPDTLVPTNPGGTFTGNIFLNVFNPDNAQIGSNTITYTIQTPEGCSSSTSQTTEVFDAPISLFTVEELTLTAFSSGPNITYQWYSCSGDSIIPGATSQIYEVSENGSYALIVSNNECTDTSKCELIDNVGMNEYDKIPIVIYPNPNNGLFNIELPSNSELNVYDAVGKLVHKENLQSGLNVIDMKANAETGVYILEIINDNGIKSVHNLVVRQ